jgi:hypothetical protein
MKKIISLLLVVFTVAAMFAFTACDKATTDTNEPSTSDSDVSESSALKFGLGVVTEMDEPKNADGDTNGEATINTTAVAVLLDAEGKIVDVAVDTLQAETEWTSEGKAVAATEAKTKYELGTEYNMAAYGKKHDGSEGKVLEWFEQIDAFVATAKGKTVAEVKAFMTEDTYTTGELAAAGCTISVGSIISALDKAVANAVDTDATSADKLNMAFATSISNTDATEEKDGTVEVNATICAVVADADGKVVVAKTDVAQTKVSFDLAGASTTDTAAELKTKGELGDAYNMAAYGKKHDGSEGTVLEWYAQAAAFDAALVGKTAADFAAFADETGYATGDLATAGCTINVGDMIKAATAAATVA